MGIIPEYLQEYFVLAVFALLLLQLVSVVITFVYPSNHTTYISNTRNTTSEYSVINEVNGKGLPKKTVSILPTNQSTTTESSSGGAEHDDVISITAYYARRGQLWSKHPSWVLDAPRQPDAKQYGEGVGHVVAILKKYDVDPVRGFLPSQDPLQRLSYARYHIWEDLADDLPKLLGARLGQARGPLRRLPVISVETLVTDEELRRAHLLLCLFAHAYVWGGETPIAEIPEGIARPLCEVSDKLGIPPVLGHPSIVLYNWRRLDTEGDICMENLSTLNNFFDGRDESWFYLITVEIEARGAPAVVPMMLAIDAIQRSLEEMNLDSKTKSPPHQDEKEWIRDDDNSRSSSIASRSSSVGDLDEASVDERLLLPGVAFTVGSAERRKRSNSESGSRRKRSAQPKDHLRQGRYLLSNLSSSRDIKLLPKQQTTEKFAPNEALVGDLSRNRVAEFVTSQLERVAAAVKAMCDSLDTMREGCHPFIFYHRVRPFLSAWKQNPTLPLGVIYRGVNDDEPMKFYGGSAAQSSLIPFLDICLGVSHENSGSQDFLIAMRDYMTRNHREFLIYMDKVACIRDFIVDGMRINGIEVGCDPTLLTASNSDIDSFSNFSNQQIWIDLRDMYDRCIEYLKKFRSTHISLVTEYIMSQQKKGMIDKKSIEGSAGGKGTGGTDLMSFLKPPRDHCAESLLSSPAPKPLVVDKADYVKSNADLGDIDVFGSWGPLERERYGW